MSGFILGAVIGVLLFIDYKAGWKVTGWLWAKLTGK
jgi:hypothetical protein